MRIALVTDPVGAYAAFARRHRGCPSGRLSSPPITCPRCSRRSGRAAGISRCATWTHSRCGAPSKRSAPSPRSCTTTARHDALDLLLPRAQDQHRAWAEAAAGYSPEAEALLAIARGARPAALASGGAA